MSQKLSPTKEGDVLGTVTDVIGRLGLVHIDAPSEAVEFTRVFLQPFDRVPDVIEQCVDAAGSNGRVVLLRSSSVAARDIFSR